jgi:hypothetical protein
VKKIEIDRAIAILANLGVIAGIVFLGVELNQNNQLLQAQVRSDRASVRRASLLRYLENPQLMSAFVKARAGEPLSSEEHQYIEFQNDAVLADWEYIYGEYSLGLLHDDDVPIEGWRLAFGENPNLLNRWQQIRATVSPEFAQWMEDYVVPP